MASSEGDADSGLQYPWRDRELMEKLYAEKKMSTKDIAEELDCAQSTVQNWLKRLGIGTRSREEGQELYFNNRYRVPYQVKNRGSCAWRPDADTTVYVHRLLAVSEWGVEAVAGNDVHHKNGVPWDNRVENLEIMSHGEHSSHHKSVSWLDVLRMAEMYRSGASTYDLAPIFDVSGPTVARHIREFDEGLIRDNIEASKQARGC